MKYLEKAKLILARDGFPALLVKIKDKIFHILTNRLLKPFFNKTQASPLPRLQPIKLETVNNSETNPQFSILIYVYSNPVYIHNCLVALRENIANLSSCEVILINDVGDDEINKFLKKVSGIKVIYNPTKLGKNPSFNRAASEAKGKFLIFLDQDCQIKANWLENLLLVAEQAPQVTAVGSKLIYEDGKLHSAAGIVWQDGRCDLYGNQAEKTDEPEYNYARRVDFCFLLGLLIKADFYRKVEGFSSLYTSDLYTSAELCLAIQKLNFYHNNPDRLDNYKVSYQPKSELIYRHHSSTEFAINNLSSNSDRSDKSLTTISRSTDQLKFIHTWQQDLKQFLPYSLKDSLQAARRLSPKPTILIIDTLVPFHDKDSGSFRLFNIIKIFQSFNFQVMFLPDYGHDQEPYTSELENMGIEVLLYRDRNQADRRELLEARLELIDLAWVCRPELCEKYFPTLKQNPNLKIIYDTIDLHFVRMKREAEILNGSSKSHQLKLSKSNQDAEKAWQDIQALEVRSSQAADVTIVVTDVEKTTLESLESGRVCVVPNIHHAYSHAIPKLGDRHGILFIGGYYHKPNIDAVIWLCQVIMPLVWAVQPEITLTLLGSNPSPAVKALANQKVFVPGYIKDVEPYFLNHRLFVAPLRYGAGMKGKIGHSLSYGLPTVTTNIGAEGMNLISGKNALIADDAASLAQCILDIYNDEVLWQEISQNSIQAIAQYSPKSVQTILANIISSLLLAWQAPS